MKYNLNRSAARLLARLGLLGACAMFSTLAALSSFAVSAQTPG